jgi:hypothetical protein
MKVFDGNAWALSKVKNNFFLCKEFLKTIERRGGKIDPPIDTMNHSKMKAVDEIMNQLEQREANHD